MWLGRAARPSASWALRLRPALRLRLRLRLKGTSVRLRLRLALQPPLALRGSPHHHPRIRWGDLRSLQSKSESVGPHPHHPPHPLPPPPPPEFELGAHAGDRGGSRSPRRPTPKRKAAFRPSRRQLCITCAAGIYRPMWWRPFGRRTCWLAWCPRTKPGVWEGPPPPSPRPPLPPYHPTPCPLPPPPYGRPGRGECT